MDTVLMPGCQLCNLTEQLLFAQGSVDVVLMPGEFDPSNHVMPQQPLHRCMFPQSAALATFASVTNPHDCVIDGVR